MKSKYTLVALTVIAIALLGTTPSHAGQKLTDLSDKITLDAQVRVRPEFRKDLSQTVPAIPGNREEDFSVLLRSRLGLRFDMTDHLSFYIQAQDARDFGEEVAAVPTVAGDDEGFDLHQGYVDYNNIADSNFSLRLGRQDINLGDQRLVGAVDWSNVGRPFDGMVLGYNTDKFSLSSFATMQNKTAAGDQTWFGGLYGSWKGFPNGVLDVYYLLLQDNDGAAGVAAGTGNTLSVHTGGVRLVTKPGNWDFGFEGAAQFGKFGSNSILAYAGHGHAGYTWKDTRVKPRFGIEGNYATGDDGANNKFTRFNNLFPSNHNKYGFMDLAAWSNIVDGVASVSLSPDKWKLGLDYHLLMVAQSSDATGFGGIAGAAGYRKLAGHEVDATVGYTLNEYANLLFGYSILAPGGFLKDAGVTTWSHLGYVQAVASF